MKIRDFFENLYDFWKEYRKVKSGLVGLAILGIFIFLGIFGNLLVPFPGATEKWRSIDFWQDNPHSAPPVWINLFSRNKGVTSSVISRYEKIEEDLGDGIKMETYEFSYKYNANKPPRDMIMAYSGSGMLPVMISLERPDGQIADLYSDQLVLSENEEQRISIERNCVQNTIEFIRNLDSELASTLNPGLVKPLEILFSELNSNMIENPMPLKGTYTIRLRSILLNEESKVEDPTIIVGGYYSGILGTDSSKRDIFTGLIIGVRWALIIGLLTSIITVLVGVILGVLAAYFGGITNWLLSRLYELIYFLPVLPFLIVIAAIFKPSIWTLIGLICIFFWTSAFKPVYGMALQIKEETFVEASKALGSGSWRVIFKHIIAILLPYTFAVMALSIPAVIVYEASISILGLGDPTIVTWGQILQDAWRQGAVINNFWWWVIPPGLSIVLMGMSFAFIGTAMDKILHPKLKTR